ncbi:MAG: hypothetical protein BWY83_02734 [bacterium ADurb.Bin478]|nr:MAG: hypothetical protein BWY83_02734 [bacterium ADurb.Bin478]
MPFHGIPENRFMPERRLAAIVTAGDPTGSSGHGFQPGDPFKQLISHSPVRRIFGKRIFIAIADQEVTGLVQSVGMAADHRAIESGRRKNDAGQNEAFIPVIPACDLLVPLDPDMQGVRGCGIDRFALAGGRITGAKNEAEKNQRPECVQEYPQRKDERPDNRGLPPCLLNQNNQSADEKQAVMQLLTRSKPFIHRRIFPAELERRHGLGKKFRRH